MSHFKSRVYGLHQRGWLPRALAGYKLPKKSPPANCASRFWAGRWCELASTFETTLPGSLRTLLRQQYPGRDIEVINAGIQSCVSRQSLAQLLFTVVDYHPDIVILYDGGNDLGLPLTYESRPEFPVQLPDHGGGMGSLPRRNAGLLWQLALERSNLYRLIRARLHPDQRNMVPTADSPFAGTNARPRREDNDGPSLRRRPRVCVSFQLAKADRISAAYHYRP